MNIIQRAKAPTPKFFRVLRNVGMFLAGLSTALVAVPEVPAGVVTVASYLGVAGGVATAVSQVAVKKEEDGDTADGDERP